MMKWVCPPNVLCNHLVTYKHNLYDNSYHNLKRERERERDLYTLTNRKREGERGREACDNRKREGGELVVFMCTTSERMLNYSIYGLRFSTVKDFTTHTHTLTDTVCTSYSLN